MFFILVENYPKSAQLSTGKMKFLKLFLALKLTAFDRFMAFMIPAGQAKFAFVIAERPKYNPGEPEPVEQWTKFLSNIQKIHTPHPNTETIHENVWLIPLKTELPFVSKLVEWAASCHIPLYIQFLDDKPDWIKYPPDAAPGP
jgi:hypothetical protein